MLFKIVLLLTLVTSSAYADVTREFLVKWEGYRNTIYICPSGYPTVGIGHNLSKEPKLKRQYTVKDVETFYNNDVLLAKQIANKHITAFHSKPIDVQLVTISLIFTVGPNGFAKFEKYIAAVNNENYKTAAKELKNSKWFSQVAKSRALDHYNRLKAQVVN